MWICSQSLHITLINISSLINISYYSQESGRRSNLLFPGTSQFSQKLREQRRGQIPGSSSGEAQGHHRRCRGRNSIFHSGYHSVCMRCQNLQQAQEAEARKRWGVPISTAVFASVSLFIENFAGVGRFFRCLKFMIDLICTKNYSLAFKLWYSIFVHFVIIRSWQFIC